MDIEKRRKELVRFYNETAESFESAYRRSDGEGASNRRYNTERSLVEQRVRAFGHGHLCDIGAGTGYWLHRYLPNVDKATLIEPAGGMLREIKSKLGTSDSGRVDLRKGDHAAVSGEQFDTILLSSVLGHYPIVNQVEILKTLVRSIRPDGELLIIDSLWNMSAKHLHPQRSGYVLRKQDSAFSLFKHYFKESEVMDIIVQSGLNMIEKFFGEYFWFSTCTLSGPAGESLS